MFTAEEVAAGVFFKMRLFQKGALWSTQALFTTEQVAAAAFVFLERKINMPFLNST